jgi:periplasmic divalent cation tolerance protein
MNPTPEPVLLYTTWPDAERADAAGRALVERRLAACVNRLAPMVSTYSWEGKFETATEVPMLIKSTRARLDDLMAAIPRLHPYDVPAILVLPVVGVHAPFAGWIAEQTADRPTAVLPEQVPPGFEGARDG